MTNDDSTGWARRVSENFGKGYTPEQLRDLDAAFSPLTEQDAERLYAHLKMSTRSSFKVDLVAISEAKAQLGISSGGGSSNLPQLQTVKWICQICSRTFNFNYLPREGDEYREIFSMCPHCGFVPRVTMYLEGNRVTYIGDQKKMELMKIKNVRGQSTVDYYKAKRGEFFDKVKERDSEIKLFTEKGMNEEYQRLVDRRRFS